MTHVDKPQPERQQEQSSEQVGAAKTKKKRPPNLARKNGQTWRTSDHKDKVGRERWSKT